MIDVPFKEYTEWAGEEDIDIDDIDIDDFSDEELVRLKKIFLDFSLVISYNSNGKRNKIKKV